MTEPHAAENEPSDELAVVVTELLDRLNRGEALDPLHILTEHPENGQEILDELEAFVELEMMPATMADVAPLGTLGDYTLRRQIGRGGMGVVYEAWQNSVERTVALKILPGAVAVDDRAFHRFMREARTAARLSHPNIVGVHGMGQEENTPYFAMEYIEGETLIQLNEAGSATDTRFGKKDDVRYFHNLAGAFAEVADGLQHAHSKGVVHRDIKPSNLILDGDDRLRILDFGLARLEGQESLTLSGDLVGTPLYMSPEQARRKKIPVDHRTDIYSLGATMYEALTGQPPFRGRDHADTLSQIIERDPVEPRAVNSRVPTDFETIVLKCLRKDVDDRYGTAEALGQDLRRFVRGEPIEGRPRSRWEKVGRRLWYHRVRVGSAATFAALLLVLLGWWVQWQQEKIALRETIPRIQALVQEEDWVGAYRLAEKAERQLGSDPVLEGLFAQISARATIETTPPGARVFARLYDGPSDDWTFLGVTPLEDVRQPRGYYHVRLETGGARPVELCGSWEKVKRVKFPLAPWTEAPSGMVYSRSYQPWSLGLTGLGHVRLLTVPSFYIDRHETTNREYQDFVDAGGYTNPAFWEAPLQGHGLSWEEIAGRFRDRTGHAGPSTWKHGQHLEGHEEYPVCGISWFEAAAYARYRGKRLPSVYHWTVAVRLSNAAHMIPRSNIGRKELAPVGQHDGVSACGAYDMIGNVREWCWNDSGEGRYILGAASSAESYLFNQGTALDPFNRDAQNGVRCMRLAKGDDAPGELWLRLEIKNPRIVAEIPIDDLEFEKLRDLFAPDRDPGTLDVRSESLEETEQYYRERVTFNASYGDERMAAFVFTPKDRPGPWPVVCVFPGMGATRKTSSTTGKLDQIWHIEMLLGMGRAVIYPIYKGTYERGEGQEALEWSEEITRERLTQMAMDFSRSIDFLETRDDLNSSELGYYGVSYGGEVAPYLLAIEERVGAAVLVSGGLTNLNVSGSFRAEHFAPRVRVPVLMLNGKFDFIFPLKEAQEPLYRLLGTTQKNHELFDSAHSVPAEAMIEMTGLWFDKYLGPVDGREE